MGLFFGTDGFRGEFAKTITEKEAFLFGNALAQVANLKAKKLNKKKPKILIATDTRASGDVLMNSFSVGAMLAGVDVCFVGVCPTAGVGFLTKQKGFDLGVVISASHNPAEFNGIKIFKSNGTKIDEEIETEIEKKILKTERKNQNLGKFKVDERLIFEYKKFLTDSVLRESKKEKPFLNMKIVLDCANGAASSIAPEIFEKLGARVVMIGCHPNGRNINKNVGALYIENLQQKVVEEKADMGFAFDGDSDRVLAVDSDGGVVDGDQLVYIFAKYYLKCGKLKNKIVVGTHHTNMGVEIALKNEGVKLIRTNIGDKYVSEILENENLLIGGEQSGHVFLKDKLETGDGVLNALILSMICVNENLELKIISKVQKYHQKNISVKVKNKDLILSDEDLKKQIEIHKNKINGIKVMVRASGTEPKIRIMTECTEEEISEFVAEELAKMIQKIDSRGGLCVE